MSQKESKRQPLKRQHDNTRTKFGQWRYLLLNVICLLNVIIADIHLDVFRFIIAIASLIAITIMLLYSFIIPPMSINFPYPRTLFISLCVISYVVVFIEIYLPK